LGGGLGIGWLAETNYLDIRHLHSKKSLKFVAKDISARLRYIHDTDWS
jgi:hypothetical protein